MRVEEKEIITKEKVYVADDGTEFNNEPDCKEYELTKIRTERLAAIEKFRVFDLYNQIPLNDDSCFSEFNDYIWFRFNNEEEEKEFEEIMETVIRAGTEYPKYFCIETENDFDEYANVSDWTYNLEQSMNVAKRYFNMFGIDIEFKRREDS